MGKKHASCRSGHERSAAHQHFVRGGQPTTGSQVGVERPPGAAHDVEGERVGGEGSKALRSHCGQQREEFALRVDDERRSDGHDHGAGLARASLAQREDVAGEHTAGDEPIGEDRLPFRHDDSRLVGFRRDPTRRWAHPVDESERLREIGGDRDLLRQQATVEALERPDVFRRHRTPDIGTGGLHEGLERPGPAGATLR